jgi:hypothetical protein
MHDIKKKEKYTSRRLETYDNIFILMHVFAIIYIGEFLTLLTDSRLCASRLPVYRRQQDTQLI